MSLDIENSDLSAAAIESFIPIRIQAEDALFGNNGSVATAPVVVSVASATAANNPNDVLNADAADGDAYVDFNGLTGEFIEFTVNVDEAGTYDVAFGYALSRNADGSERNRSLRIDVNNDQFDRIGDFKSTSTNNNTGDFTAIAEKILRLELQAGENIIRLSSYGLSGPNIDYLEVRAPDPTVVVIQAEDLVVTTDTATPTTVNRSIDLAFLAARSAAGQGNETFRVGAEGDAYLDWSGGAGVSTADLTIDVPVAGEYRITITYANGGTAPRPLGLTKVIEGVSTAIPGVTGFTFAQATAAMTPGAYPDDFADIPTLLRPADGSDAGTTPDPTVWEAWREETITVTLEAGSNTLRLSGSNGPNIDKIVVALSSSAPSDITLDQTTVAENDAGAVIGQVDVVDLDGDAYMFVVDDARFAISPEGVLSLVAGASLDFETETSVELEITANGPGGQTLTRSFLLTVTNDPSDDVVPNTPPGVVTLTGSVAENAPGALVGVLSSIDPDGDPINFSTSDARFVISGNQISLAAGVSLDHEGSAVIIPVTANDGRGGVTVTDVSVTVTDVNEAPSLMGTIAPQSVVAGDELTVDLSGLVASDPDGDGTTLVARLSNGSPLPAGITLAGTNLIVSASAAAASYDIVILATDNALESNPVAISLTVEDPANEAPVITSPASFSIDENGTVVGAVTATDADGGTLVYGIAGGADAALFSIDPATGALAFLAAPDFEAPADANSDNVYAVTVSVSDGEATTTQDVTVTVGDVADTAPVFPLIIEGEAFAITDTVGTTGSALTQARTPSNPETSQVLRDTNGDSLWDGFSGTGYLDMGGNAGDAGSFTFEAAEAGTYQFTFRYSNGGTALTDRPMTVSVDGGPTLATPLFPTTGSNNWDVLAEEIVDIDLTAGSHTIKLANVGGAGPNIDRVTIDLLPPVVNTAPEITSGSAFTIAENGTAVTTIAATDADNDALTYSISGGADASKFTIDATTGALAFVAAPDFETPGDVGGNNVYEVQVTASDGELSDVQSIAVTVTDVNENVEPPVFTPLVLQAEDAAVLVLDVDANTNDTTIRNAQNPETGANFPPGGGLRPNFSGTGYLDFGDTPGDKVTFTVNVPLAGTYDLNVRYASNSNRPLDLAVNGGAPVLTPFNATGIPAAGGIPAVEGFDNWVFTTVSVTLAAGSNTISFAIPAGANTGPNIDRIEITEAGTGPIPVDASADEDGNLAIVSLDPSVAPGDADAVQFRVTGVDDDVTTFDISFDGGATRSPVTPVDEGNGSFLITADLSGLPAGNRQATVFVTDATGNEASAAAPVVIEGTGVQPFELTIQAETFTPIDTTGTGNGITQARVPGNVEPNAIARDTDGDNLWDGFTGSGYLDMGADIGDAASFVVDAPAAGVYTLTFRYANGGNVNGVNGDRPMAISVNGANAGNASFPGTGVNNWDVWAETTFDVTLVQGQNTIVIANTIANGPNIDRVVVSNNVDPVEPPSEPGERLVIKVNFQPDTDVAGRNPNFVTPAGFVADVGLAFGQQSVTIDGQTFQYGWVSEASIADGTANGTTPIGIKNQLGVAVNDRTDDIAGLDPLQGTYAHFDHPTYTQAAGWEIELPNGYYEVTISIGDTSGPYDSTNVVNAEGELFNDPFTPFRPADFPADANPSNDTQGFRSDLVTKIVKVEDGRLTLDSIGGTNTEIQYIEIKELPDLTPADAREAPEDYAFFTEPRAVAGVGQNAVTVDLDPANGAAPTGVDPNSDFFVGISVVDGRGGALLASLNDGSIKLFETVTGIEVPISVNTTGGFDSLTISPSQPLKEFTGYTLKIEGFQDRGANDDPASATREFQKFTTTFVTGESEEVVPREVAFNPVVELDGAADGAFGFTSIEMSADGSTLYIATITGEIKRFTVNPTTGALQNEQTLSLPYFDDPSGEGRRGIIGLAVDPNDPNVLWVTDNFPIPLSGRDDGVPDFSGRVTKLTVGTGPTFTATAETYISGLPRSNGDHVTNSLEFRPNPAYDAVTNPDAPTHLLYLVQGSNSAMGEPDSAWGFRPERLLNAAILEIDPTRDPPPGGFNVATEPLPADGLNRRFTDNDTNVKDDPIPMGNGQFLVFAPNGSATVQNAAGDVLQTYYDPFANDAVLKIFATGVRNAYDLVWHSNGQLYVPTNGSAAGGAVPDDPTTPQNERITNVGTQNDYLFSVSQGGYYGHPNPLRDEYILNGGNPTSGPDTNQVGNYPVGTLPDTNYQIQDAYSLGQNRSPNGVIEYTSNVFGGNLKNNILFTEYSGGNDIRSITLDANGNIIGDDVLRDINGNVITYVDPLDIIQNPLTGQLYLLTLDRSNGQSKIVRLDPAPGGVIIDPEDPEEPGDLVSILKIQAEDATPNDGTAVAISTAAGAQIEIRTMANPEDDPERPALVNGLRPGAFGLDGNTNDNDGETGGYADFGATNADFLTFTFQLTPTQAGESVLQVRYANGGTANRPLEVFVNNISVGVFQFAPPSGVTGDAAWATWQLQDIPAELVSGANTVRFQAIANTGPNIDQLEIFQAPPTQNPEFTDYEAENAALVGAVVIPETVDDRNASGTGYVDFTSGADQSITWTIQVDADGTYDLAVRYALAVSKGNRPLELTVNGVSLGSIDFIGQSNATESDWFFKEISVLLQSGANTISLTAPDAIGPNVDLLRVPSEPADTFVPTYADVDGETRIELESGDTARTVNARTADFYFTVAADGLYSLGLAANPGAPGVGQLGLFLNGQNVADLVYPGQGDAGEKTAFVQLEAGVQYNLRVVSSADGADVLDYLDVAPVTGDPNADISVQSNDPTFFDNRVHFSWIDNPASSANTNGVDRNFKESGSVTITNNGTAPLSVLDWSLDGPFSLQDGDALDGLIIAPGQSVTVGILFNRSAYTAPTQESVTGVFEGKLEIVTNDAGNPVTTVDLAGFWQLRDEGGWEPSVNEMWKVFGFGNFIEGLPNVAGGENSVLNDFDLYRPKDETEVLSRYWQIAEGVDQVRITHIGAFHSPGGATVGIHGPGNNGSANDIDFWNHAGDSNQSILPLLGNGNFATATFTRDTIPNGWLGNDLFGIEIAGLSTDPSLNPEGGGTPPPDAAGIERGYTVRIFQAVDKNGDIIPNVYLGVMDYTGINYDYNDNMIVIEGIAPASPAEISVVNLDGVPGNDRLVMSRIENPANANQVFHDEATIRINNDGYQNLTISSLSIADPTLFQIVGPTSGITIAPGGFLDVTVRFIAVDTNAASLYESTLTIVSNDLDEGTKVIDLAGLAQGQSESGQEPTVQDIVNAFGFTTNVAEAQMNKGGLVEANGDEILAPYFVRASGGSPIQITQLAAYHTQGDVARLFIHDVDNRALTQVIAHDEQDGQTLLPRTLNGGDQIARATINRDDPFGFFAEITTRQGYISWSDPDANLYEDTVDEIGNPGTNLNWDQNDGHLIRVYVAKDKDGTVIPDTYIVIQDYAGVNYDYNDNIFLVKNVKPYDPAGVEDADGNGRVDIYDDADNDGVPNFLDPDQGGGGDPGQKAFNDTQTPWLVDDAVTIDAWRYDSGGPGVAYQDSSETQLGSNFRPGGVDIVGNGAAIGWIENNEWVEYTITVEEAGVYDLTFLSAFGATGARSITAAFQQGGVFYETSSAVTVPPTGGWTTFVPTSPTQVELQAGVQVLRVTFNGGAQDLKSITLEKANTAPVVDEGIADRAVPEDQPLNFAVPADAFADVDGDTLTYTATGLPQGVTITPQGVISGTPATPGIFAVTVIASDGKATASTTFDLTVEAAGAPGQTAFNDTQTPWAVDDAITIEAWRYDNGGPGVAYQDSSQTQLGSNFRPGGVDIVGNGAAIGWIENNEWVEYTINVEEAGEYDLNFLSALGTTGGAARSITAAFQKNGVFYETATPVAVTPTATWTTFQPTGSTRVELEAGVQVVRLTFNGGSQDLKSLTFDKVDVAPPVNLAPSDIVLSNDSVAENSANGTIVGALSAIDPNAGDTATFSLLNNAGGRFSIVNGNLVVAGSLDFETATSHQVTVRVTDGGGLFRDEIFTIAVTDVNEAPANQPPSDIVLSNTSVAENSANGTIVGALSAVDPNAGDTATFSLLDNAGGRFSIVNGNLVVAGSLDFETATSHQVTVRVTDSGGLFRDEIFTIAVTDVNEAPPPATGVTIIGTAGGDVINVGQTVQGQPLPTSAGDTIISGEGADIIDGFGGADSINAGGGNDRVLYNTSAVFINGGSGRDVLVTTSTDVIDLGNGPDQSQGTPVVTGFDDVDGSGATVNLTMSGNVNSNTLQGGSGNDTFRGGGGTDTVLGNGGIDQALFTGALANYTITQLSATSWRVQDNRVGAPDGRVTVTDVENLVFTDQTVTLIGAPPPPPANQPPSDIVLSNASVAENSANGTIVGALSAVDPNAGDTATFSLLNNAGGRFSIVNGNLVVAGSLDFETATSHQVTVRVTDGGGLFRDEVFTIAVTDVNEAPANQPPSDIVLSNTSVAENSANGTIVGALSAVDPNAGDTATFSLLDNAGGRFSIVNGNLVVAGSLDFETATSHQVTVRVTDGGGLFRDEVFTIAVTDVNEAPPPATGVTIIGTAGGDVINATQSVAGQPLPTNAADTINSGEGNDIIDGLAGADSINAAGGNDRVLYNPNAVFINGGSGRDVLVTTSTDVIDLGNGPDQSQGTPVVTGFDDVDGSGATVNLTMSGNVNSNTLQGGSGNDTFRGGGGTDTVLGNGGIDQALFTGTLANYTITQLAASTWRVQDNRVGTPDGRVTVTDVEDLVFTDQVLNLIAPAPLNGAQAFGMFSVLEEEGEPSAMRMATTFDTFSDSIPIPAFESSAPAQRYSWEHSAPIEQAMESNGPKSYDCEEPLSEPFAFCEVPLPVDVTQRADLSI
jgi:hypothetical protein